MKEGKVTKNGNFSVIYQRVPH